MRCGQIREHMVFLIVWMLRMMLFTPWLLFMYLCQCEQWGWSQLEKAMYYSSLSGGEIVWGYTEGQRPGNVIPRCSVTTGFMCSPSTQFSSAGVSDLTCVYLEEKVIVLSVSPWSLLASVIQKKSIDTFYTENIIFFIFIFLHYVPKWIFENFCIL